ncbi:hypothetical protein LTR10_004178 [Elasticomyces elasticus]|nr:hypothetical protein LTR10_004178 [Elasticomyces elasticus]KAK4977638.1 hypothetical protein LTR42_002009 [Elasticomyces elasticus]
MTNDFTITIHAGKHRSKNDKLQELVDEHLRRTFDSPGPPPLSASFECPTNPHPSTAALPTCPETCEICQEHYLPKPFLEKVYMRRVLKFHSDDEARSSAQSFVASTSLSLGLVRQKLDNYGDIVLKRWKRASIPRRAALVRKAIPEAYSQNFAGVRMMYDNQRRVSGLFPNSMSLKDFTPRVLQKLEQAQIGDRKAYLLPYLDVQTLSEDPMNLLAILHYRSHSTSADWALLDCEILRINWNFIQDHHVYNPHCVIMYGKHYGRLIPWNKDSAHKQNIIGYPRAAAILEAQSELATFLLNMISLILDTGVQDSSMGRVQWDLLADVDFQWQRSSGSLTRRLDTYRAAPVYDIRAIVRTLEGRAEAMADELHSLQSDPLYLRNRLRHFQNTVLHDTLTEEEQQSQAITITLGYVGWATLFRIATTYTAYTLSIQQRYEGQIQVGKPLPEEYAAALVLLRTHLTNMFQGQMLDLNILQAVSKTFQDQQSNYDADGNMVCEFAGEELFQKHPLLHNVIELQHSHPYSFGSTYNLAFIDYLINRESGKERVDDVFAAHISNMMVVDDVLTCDPIPQTSARYTTDQRGPSQTRCE